MQIINQLKKIYWFFRWQLKPIREITKCMYAFTRNGKKTTVSHSASKIEHQYLKDLRANGYAAIKENIALTPVPISKFQSLSGSQSFVNVADKEWPAVKNFLIDVLTNEHLSSTICNYFEGNPWLWNIALNYSEANKRLSDSQLWHFDYGDTRQLHLMAYFNDVDLDTGPFTFLTAVESDKVKRTAWIIERLTDKDLSDQYGIDVATQAIRLTGATGELFLTDPGRVMHQGARCNKPRLVLFATFTSVTPMSLGGSKTLRVDQRKDLYDAYQAKVSTPLFTQEFFL
jgi:hypothetical protein